MTSYIANEKGLLNMKKVDLSEYRRYFAHFHIFDTKAISTRYISSPEQNGLYLLEETLLCNTRYVGMDSNGRLLDIIYGDVTEAHLDVESNTAKLTVKAILDYKKFGFKTADGRKEPFVFAGSVICKDTPIRKVISVRPKYNERNIKNLLEMSIDVTVKKPDVTGETVLVDAIVEVYPDFVYVRQKGHEFGYIGSDLKSMLLNLPT